MGKLIAVGDLYAMSTYIKLEELRQYLDVLNKQITAMGKDYYLKMEENAKKIENPQLQKDYYENVMEELWSYTERFPRIFMNSSIIIAYSLLETQTNGVAKRMQKKFNDFPDLNKNKERGNLEAAVLKIEKLTGVKAKRFSSWNDIKDVQRLRNIIVHANGYMAVDNQKDIDLAQKYNVLDQSMIDMNGRSISMVLITSDYCLAFLDTLDSFFADLHSQTK